MSIKFCNDCGKYKPTSEFWKSKTTKDGLQAYCKVHSYARTKKTGKTDKGRTAVRKSRLKTRYGLSWEEAEKILKSQNNKCANLGCGQYITIEPQTKNSLFSAHFDHDHNTGKVRSALCYGCNVSLGYLKEDNSRILGLSEYILKHK